MKIYRAGDYIYYEDGNIKFHCGKYDVSFFDKGNNKIEIRFNISNIPVLAANGNKYSDLNKTYSVFAVLNSKGTAYGSTYMDVVNGINGVDESSLALISIDYAHHERHEGDAFVLHDWEDLGAEDYVDYRIVVPETLKYPHMLLEIATEAESNFYFYEGVTILSPGTAVTSFNANRNSNSVSSLTFTKIDNTSEANANLDTGTATATLLMIGRVGSSRTAGGQVGTRDELILKSNTIYSIRILNLDNSASRWINVSLDWYEHTDKL